MWDRGNWNLCVIFSYNNIITQWLYWVKFLINTIMIYMLILCSSMTGKLFFMSANNFLQTLWVCFLLFSWVKPAWTTIIKMTIQFHINKIKCALNVHEKAGYRGGKVRSYCKPVKLKYFLMHILSKVYFILLKLFLVVPESAIFGSGSS